MSTFLSSTAAAARRMLIRPSALRGMTSMLPHGRSSFHTTTTTTNATASDTPAPRILITGSGGQIGSELVGALRAKYGRDSVVASDLKTPTREQLDEGPFVFLDACDGARLENVVCGEKIDWVIHNAAFLSATAEKHVQAALKLNCDGLHNVLRVGHENGCRVFVPSSIAAFGRSTPLDNTPDFTIQRPESIYGIGKIYAELLGEYYNMKKGLDFRSLRYPGIISYKTMPGGGTTDYAVDMFFYALRGEHYECYLTPDVYLPMMYMPDCIKATMDIMEAPEQDLKHRVFNVTSFSFTPKQLADVITKFVPSFSVSYVPDNLRQPFAESWPNSLDDSHARDQWKWREAYGLEDMVKDMLVNIAKMQPPKVELVGIDL